MDNKYESVTLNKIKVGLITSHIHHSKFQAPFLPPRFACVGVYKELVIHSVLILWVPNSHLLCD